MPENPNYSVITNDFVLSQFLHPSLQRKPPPLRVVSNWIPRRYASSLGKRRNFPSCLILDQEAVQNVSKPVIFGTGVNIDHPTDDEALEQVIGGNITIIEGRDLVLACPVGGEPPPTIEWQFNGKKVTSI